MTTGGYERLPAGSGRGIILKKVAASQEEDILRIENEVANPSTSTVWLRVSSGGYLIVKQNAAPADAVLSNSELATWLDNTSGNPKVMAKVKDSAGVVFAKVLSLDTPVIGRRLMAALANPGLATASTVAYPAAPTLTATATNADDAEGPWINHATTAISGNATGIVPAAYNYVRPGWVPDTEMTLKTGSLAADITTARIMAGLFSAVPDASSPGTLHGAWFRYDTAIDGTAFWRTCTGAGAAPTVTTTGIAIAYNTFYKLRIEFVGTKGVDPTSVKFYINDVLIATHTLTLPLANQQLSPAIRLTTLSAAARNLKWAKILMLAN